MSILERLRAELPLDPQDEQRLIDAISNCKATPYLEESPEPTNQELDRMMDQYEKERKV